MSGNSKGNNYNMTEIYRRSVHSPIDRNGNIYYIPREGASGLSTEELNASKNVNWLFDTKSTYNSPTNIRRIWFTARLVIVEYYAAPKRVVKNGESVSTGLVMTKGLGGNDFRDIAKQLLTLLSIPEGQRKSAIQSGYMKGIEVTGSVFKSKGLYVFNNLEEVYFDWTALISKDTEQIYAPLLGVDRRQIIGTYLNNGRFGKQENSNVPLALFLGTPNPEKVNANYKRLKRVVMISHLQDILDNFITDKGSIMKHIDRFDINNVEEISRSWLDRQDVMEAIQATNSDVLISNIQNTTVKNTSMDCFKIKPNDYVFDHEILNEKIQKYVDKVNDLKKEEGFTARREREREKQIQQEEQAQQDIENTPEEGSVFELYNEIKEMYGELTAKKALACALYDGDNQDYGLALRGMSDKTKETCKIELVKLNNAVKRQKKV